MPRHSNAVRDENAGHAPLLDALLIALDRHADPLLIVAANRQLLYRNLAATRLLQTVDGLENRDGRFSTGSPAGDRRLEKLLSAMHQQTSGLLTSRGLRWQSRGARTGGYLAVHALQSRASMPETAPAALIHVVGGLRPGSISDSVLRDLFGLTTGELLAAQQVVQTGAVVRAAAVLSISPQTVRTHLKSIFRKCEIHSMLELTLLIRSTALFSWPVPRQDRAAHGVEAPPRGVSRAVDPT